LPNTERFPATRHGQTIDLREVGLTPQEWRKLRLEAKALGVPVSALAYTAIGGPWLREKRPATEVLPIGAIKRRMLEVKIGKITFLRVSCENPPAIRRGFC